MKFIFQYKSRKIIKYIKFYQFFKKKLRQNKERQNITATLPRPPPPSLSLFSGTLCVTMQDSTVLVPPSTCLVYWWDQWCLEPWLTGAFEHEHQESRD